MDEDLKDLIISEMKVNSAFRDEVRTSFNTINTRFAAEDALKADRASRNKQLFAWLGALVAIAGVVVSILSLK